MFKPSACIGKSCRAPATKVPAASGWSTRKVYTIRGPELPVAVVVIGGALDSGAVGSVVSGRLPSELRRANRGAPLSALRLPPSGFRLPSIGGADGAALAGAGASLVPVPTT